jgi:hypothetical protein
MVRTTMAASDAMAAVQWAGPQVNGRRGTLLARRGKMDGATPMLAIIVYEAQAQAATLRNAALAAAVRAWSEGHISGEGERVSRPGPAAVPDEELPAPPFPRHGDSTLKGIIDQSCELFSSNEMIAAAACYAAGLAYAAGYAEGKRCPGCSYRGAEPKKAQMIRAGARPIWLFNGDAGVGLPQISTTSATDHETDVARRLAAAWISSNQGLRGVDYTYKGMKDEGIGAAWINLARVLTREMTGQFGDLLGLDDTDTDDGEAH